MIECQLKNKKLNQKDYNQLKTIILDNDFKFVYYNEYTDKTNKNKSFSLNQYFLDKIEGISNENAKYIENIKTFKDIIEKQKNTCGLFD